MASELEEAAASEIPETIEIDLGWPDRDDIERFRGELRLKGHLLNAELKDRWRELEKDWERVREELNPVRRAANEYAKTVRARAVRLAATIRAEYERLHIELEKQ